MTEDELRAKLDAAANWSIAAKHPVMMIWAGHAQRVAIEYAESRVAEATAELRTEHEDEIDAMIERIRCSAFGLECERDRLKEQLAALRSAVEDLFVSSRRTKHQNIVEVEALAMRQLEALLASEGTEAAEEWADRVQSIVVSPEDSEPTDGDPVCPLCNRPRSDLLSVCSHAFHAPVAETGDPEPDQEQIAERPVLSDHAKARLASDDPPKLKINPDDLFPIVDHNTGRVVEPGHLAEDMIEAPVQQVCKTCGGSNVVVMTIGHPNRLWDGYTHFEPCPECCGGSGRTDRPET